METVADVVAALTLVVGTFLTLAAAIGVRRFPNLLARLHAPAKPQVVGLALMLFGLAVTLGDPAVAWTLVLVLLFQMITAPISAHLAARAGYRTGHIGPDDLVVDDYRRDLSDSQRDGD